MVVQCGAGPADRRLPGYVAVVRSWFPVTDCSGRPLSSWLLTENFARRTNETGPAGRRDTWRRRLGPVVDNVYHCVGRVYGRLV